MLQEWLALYSYHGTDRWSSASMNVTVTQYLELYSPAVKWLLQAQRIGGDTTSKGALCAFQLEWLLLRSVGQ